MGAGLGARSPQQGISFANDVTQRPYHEAVQQWNLQTEPLKEEAGLEELGNRTKRKYIDDARDTALKQQHQQNMEDQGLNEFDRKLIDIERGYLDQQGRGADRDEDRAARLQLGKDAQSDRAERLEENKRHNREMENLGRGNLDVRKNPPPRATAPLKVTPERTANAYKQAMKELVDNPAMADFV